MKRGGIITKKAILGPNASLPAHPESNRAFFTCIHICLSKMFVVEDCKSLTGRQGGYLHRA